LFNSYSRT